MNMHLSKKRGPLIIGIFLIIAIAVTIALIQQGVLTVTRARLTTVPEKVQVTNITDTSFTVIFTTGLSTTAAIKLSEGDTGNTIILDDRDKSSGVQNNYFSHHITVPNLEPQNTYSYAIVSGGKEYTAEGKFLVTTGPEITSDPPSQNPLYGTVLLPDGAQGSDTIVVANSDSSQSISSVTDNDGNYIIPTNSLREESLSNYLTLQPESQIFLNFFRENYTAKITTNFQIGQNLPAITLNQDYSFSPEEHSPLGTPQEGFESIEQVSESSLNPTVTSPQDSQSFIDPSPSFSGVGGANRQVIISIPSVNINERVDVSSQGRWTFRPKENLPQGDYTAHFDIPDENGINQRITRDFSVLASGSQVVQTATPSATPTFTPTPTLTNTPTPTLAISPSVSPSPEVSVSPSPTIITTPTEIPTPTLTPTATLIPTSTPLPPIDSPGNISSTAILGAFSIILIVAGAAIFFAL